MILPPKSVLCMPCHTATFSVGDTTTILSLMVFTVGFLGIASVWFSGAQNSGSAFSGTIKAVFRTIFSRNLARILSAFLLDGLLQRRLFRASRERWVLHALVFFPFLFRFVWGLIALIGSLSQPASEIYWHMIDKNHPITAFLFDLSGLLVIGGVLTMIVRRIQGSSTDNSPSGLPSADWPAFALLGSAMVVGYLLEGMRMAMTVSPVGASCAFMGDLVSRFLKGYDLTGAYGYVWYLHAILTGLFVAYLPFSRMLHMIMAPVVMAINAGSGHRQ
jgi:nitrate reductase gamma subunit